MINEKQKERIEFSPIFNKKLAKVPTEIKLAVRQALELFRENPHHEALRNHLLTAGGHCIGQSLSALFLWR
jgi:hypothetical protein